uniref:DMP19 family protein n=1 Tax=Prevotella sp. GTC17259 TaxID=3236795 RepID=A0AB33J0V3_9BACT
MKEVTIQDSQLREAAEKGMDAFVSIFVNAIMEAIGGELTANNIGELNSDQITLLAYHYLHNEVMDGGFVQLIHNGYGSFMYHNPTARAFREWGMVDLYRILNKSHKVYQKHHEEIEADCTDDEFMALFERFDEFDQFDDAFVENEEQFTAMVAAYIDDHITNFATIVQE